MRRARHTLRLLTGPSVEPITTSDVKSWGKIDTSDDDALIGQLITAVRWSAEEYLRRALISQQYMLTLDLCPSLLNNALGEGTYDLPITVLYGGLERAIELQRPPIISIDLVNTYDLTNAQNLFASSNYFLDTAGCRLVLNFGCIWPTDLRPASAVEITYTAGYGTTADKIPQPIKTGMLIHAASLYEQRGQGVDEMRIPPGAMQLYNQFRVLGYRP